MKLNEIIARCSNLRIDERRKATDDHLEIVIFKNDFSEWNVIFTDILNAPIKPQGVKPTKDDLSLTQDYGGITKDQVLFKKRFDDGIIVAMFWPWKDNVHMTLKIIHLKNDKISSSRDNNRNNPKDQEQAGNSFLSKIKQFFKRDR